MWGPKLFSIFMNDPALQVDSIDLLCVHDEKICRDVGTTRGTRILPWPIANSLSFNGSTCGVMQGGRHHINGCTNRGKHTGKNID